jgi:cytochrome oxidase assembly protein ShyY1
VYRFLLTPRWLGLALFVLVLGGVTVQLGLWQFDRLHERQADNVRTGTNLAAEPVAVGPLLAGRDDVPHDLEWRAVTATGTYDADGQLIVRNQTREDGPGVTVLTPLLTDAGDTVLVERGWIGTQALPSSIPDVPDPPSGEVTVTGWLRPDSGAGSEATVPAQGTIRAVDSDRLAEALERPLLPGYVALTDQQPAPDETLEPPVAPDLGQGPHFFYGLQWFFFALLAAAGYAWFAWSEAHPKPASARRTGPRDAPRPRSDDQVPESTRG